MMSTKQKHTNRFLLFLLSFITIFILAIIIVPPMVTLNSIKPKIEATILAKTGIQTKIHGNVNFSLMGSTSIIAHNISIPNGVISSIEFKVPFFDIFNLHKANISGNIYVNGASLYVEKIAPFDIDSKIIVNNSKIHFLNKEYKIIHADFSKNDITAFVRTDQHKYEIKSTDNDFVIKNKNNNLLLSGKLLKDGTAHARISIIAQDINRWFEFKTPKITGHFPITADVYWDGGYGIKFDNISAKDVHGSIEFKDDGYKIVRLKSDKANYNMSFILKDPYILKDSYFDLNFHGNIKFGDRTFEHLKIITRGEGNKIVIENIIADDIHIEGGFIDADGAHDVNISGTLSGLHTTC